MSLKKSRSFFEVYPNEYDLLTNAVEREKTHRREVQAIMDRFRPSSVLDAGCATGLTARLFAERGVAVVGLDRAKVLLDIARTKALANKTQSKYVYGHFERLPKSFYGRFDLVVCLANAIAGVGSTSNLRKSLAGFRRVLRPGGILLLQMLNYVAVADGQIVPVRATEAGGVIYERFTERSGRRLRLYVTRLDTNTEPPKLEVFRHEFDNFTPAEIGRSLRKAGFRNLRRYGSLFLRDNFIRSSRDLVIAAARE